MQNFSSSFQPFDDGSDGTGTVDYQLPSLSQASPISPPSTRGALSQELQNAKREIDLLKSMDPFRAAEMALEIQVEKAHVKGLAKARDVAVTRLCDAYTSLREKVLRVEQLTAEKEVLEKRLETSVGGTNHEEAKEIARLEGMIRMLQEEIKWLKAGPKGMEWFPPSDDSEHFPMQDLWSISSSLSSLAIDSRQNQFHDSFMPFDNNLLAPAFPPPLSSLGTSRSPSPSPTLTAAPSLQSTIASSPSLITPSTSFGSNFGLTAPRSPSAHLKHEHESGVGYSGTYSNALGLSETRGKESNTYHEASSSAVAHSLSAPSIIMTSAPSPSGITSVKPIESPLSRTASTGIDQTPRAWNISTGPSYAGSCPSPTAEMEVEVDVSDGENKGPPSPILWSSQPVLEAHETIAARTAALATLPIPSNIPLELQPIVIPVSLTLHEFLGTASGSLRNALSNYRVFQHTTTSWCPEREEHGYYLTPVFKCNTNPRMAHAHRWTEVDVLGRMAKPTECFFNKDGKWYYAGVYRAFRMADLTMNEWAGLSNETTSTLVKDTVAARKNVSPQNTYEINQLYVCGALRVACVGLQCIGFSMALYRTILEAAERCAGRSPGAGSRGPSPQGGASAPPRSNSTTPTPSLLPVPGGDTPCGVGGGVGGGPMNLVPLPPSSSVPVLSTTAWPALSPSKVAPSSGAGG